MAISVHFFLSSGDCIGAPLTSTKRYPVIPSYGLQEITGIMLCNDTTCNRGIGASYHQFTKIIYPEAFTEVFVPRSRIIFSRKPGANIHAHFQFIPSFSNHNLYFTIEKFKILKPNFVLHCNNVVRSTQKSLSTYDLLLTAIVSNIGKVCTL